MKKAVSLILCAVLSAFAPTAEAKSAYYAFEGEENLFVVTNTLSSGGSARFAEDGFEGRALELDGSYGVCLGDVGGEFAVSAMVKITSTGGTDTIFFKNMGTASNQKWTGVQSRSGAAALWTHGDGYSWTTAAEAEEAELARWAQVVYSEKDGTGSLYVNGMKIGSGPVAEGEGTLYLGATLWAADAPKGYVDEVSLYDRAISEDEVKELYLSCAAKLMTLPATAVGNIFLPDSVLDEAIVWQSSDESVIAADGTVTRGDSDKSVTLTAYVKGEMFAEFQITVLKKAVTVNEEVILSYLFEEDGGDVIYDASGNGNHALSCNAPVFGEEGLYFDGADDYVTLPGGVLYGHDDITIIFRAKPEAAQTNMFAYCFGNGSDTGYMFLSTSRPATNELRFAMTKTGYGEEKALASVPGIGKGEWGCAVVTIEGESASLYLDGELVMDGNLGMTVSDLGATGENYIGKSLFSSDPFFKGTVGEFTILNYTMDKDEIKEKYAPVPKYAEEEKAEYIVSLSFGDSVKAELDTRYGDVILVAAAWENGTLGEFAAAVDGEVTAPEGDKIIVFAFNGEDNSPGRIYTRGRKDGIYYEYTPGRVKIVNEGASLTDGTAIIAAYNGAGELMKVVLKPGDFLSGEEYTFGADFEGIVSFRLLYWSSLEAMVPRR